MLVPDIIFSVVLGCAVMFGIALTKQVVENDGHFCPQNIDGETQKFTLGGVHNTWWWAFSGGVTVGAIYFFAPRVTNVVWLAPIFLVAMVAFCVVLMAWWRRDGGRPFEMLFFVILTVLSSAALVQAAKATATLVPDVFWRSIIGVIPPLMSTATIGFFVIDYLFFLSKMVNDEGSDEARRNRILGRVAIAITTILLAIIMGAGIAWGQMAPQAADASADATTKTTTISDDTETVTPGGWCHFYNLDLKNDGDDSNNYNFGSDPYKAGEAKDAKYYDADFRERLKWDPALAAADTAWLDAKVGTRYLGEFYESCKGDWAKTMNAAKDRFAADQMAYYEDLDAFFAFLDSAVKVEVRECQSVTDQMYMNPYTKSGVPDIIVLETTDHSGYELVYTFVIKGDTPEAAAANTFEVAYRINCGYQPTNVAKVMKITPQPSPTPGPNPSPTPGPNPEPTPGPNPEPTPTPTPTPDPPEPSNPKKDPSKLTDVNTEPNDDKGPGPDTNNPSDSQHSTADESTNSTSYDSYDDYKADIKELEEVNESQKTGGDSNEPSTPAPTKDTNVDNNADKGTGNGGIDKPTETKEPAKEADSGKPTDSKPGEAWGGPKD